MRLHVCEFIRVPHAETLNDDAPAPTYITIERTRHELGGCSRSYIYELLAQGVLRSVNPGGRRRLIEFASVKKLAGRKAAQK